MFKSFTKEDSKFEQKSYGNDLAWLLMGYNNYNSGHQLKEYIDFYYKSSPLFTALRLISDEIVSIKKVINDTKKDEFLPNSSEQPFIKLLNNPNPFTNSDLFFESLLQYYLLAGEIFIEIIGNNKPVELHILNPRHITVQSSDKDGYPETYTYQSSDFSRTFKRNKDRYIADNQNELVTLRTFNPNYGVNNLRGVPYVQPIYLELSQYLLASVHNNSLLKNQGRPSGILTFKGDGNISSDAQNAIKSFMQSDMQGAQNAGKNLFLSGDFDWKQLSESVKDMDFAKLKVQTSVAVYNAFKIPLPMISPEHMSLANMDTAKLNFYDNCVIPFYDKLSGFLTDKILVPRYKQENYELTYDEASIKALEPRRAANNEMLSKSGVLTVNELRAKLGYESIDNGDTLYQPMNLVPVGQDQFTQDNRETPASKAMKDEFANVLRKHKNEENQKLFTESEIEEMVVKYYG